MPLEYIQATPDQIRKNISVLMAIDSGVLGEPWDTDHFLCELPGKWLLSRIAYWGDVICGFCIASQKADSLHIHRIAIAPEFQGRGLGTQFLDYMCSIARANQMAMITLKVNVQNYGAFKLYNKYGFVTLPGSGTNLELRYLIPAIKFFATVSKNYEA